MRQKNCLCTANALCALHSAILELRLIATRVKSENIAFKIEGVIVLIQEHLEGGGDVKLGVRESTETAS